MKKKFLAMLVLALAAACAAPCAYAESAAAEAAAEARPMKHLVFMKFKEGMLTEEMKKDLIDTFDAIKAEVPGVESAVVRFNVVVRGQNMDTMTEMDLTDESILDAYLNHPTHVALRDRIMPKLERAVSFDYFK